MESIEKRLREEAGRLLAEGKADVVVGYEAGTLPLTAAPFFATKPEEAERLVWNRACGQNLAKYAHGLVAQHREAQKRVKPEDRKKRVVAVVAPGCATRSVAIHLNERQYGRDDVVVLGVPCSGVLDRRKLLAAAGAEELLDGRVEGDRVVAVTAEGEKAFPVASLLAESCTTCRLNNPVLWDVMLGDPAPHQDFDREYDGVTAFEKLPVEERWATFEAEMAKCMRCNACRNSCPSCYCRSCFVEQSQPQWVSIGEAQPDVQLFQFMRMFHMAGRCVDCGTCSAVCPTGVDLHKFLKKLDKDAFALFGHRAGVSPEEAAPLAEAKEDDPDEFIFNP
ncbi:MAG: 4Fe-4S ferredoxin [Deltaproteobacteria bacterium]|nr:4Fe-4S ferredoxin [Deltaproteobacteria bacterium]